MKINLKWLSLLLISLFFTCYSRASAFVDFYSDDESLNNYTIIPNGGFISIENGNMVIGSPALNHQYPLVLLKPDRYTLPIHEIEVVLKYDNISTFGAGFVVDDHFPENTFRYDVGHNSIMWTWNWGAPSTLKIGRFPFLYTVIPNQTEYHKVKISGVPGNYSIYLDDNFYGFTNSTKELANIWIGNPEIVVTTGGWPTIRIDQITITDSTPLNIFPYYSQLDPEWANDTYDTANEWAVDGNNTIGDWGCALTSTSMVLKKYDIKSPNGQEITPKILNEWLISQPDGYVGPGLLNWLAITRLVRQSRLNNYSTTDLEFVKSKNDASDMIALGLSPIINDQGHFVVAFDMVDDNLSINDPLNQDNDTIPADTPLLSVNTFVPSSTDLSYIMLVAPADATVESDGAIEYLENLTNSNGEYISYKVILIPKPTEGNYPLTIIGEKDDVVDIYLYDHDGEVISKTLELVDNQITDYMIKYSTDITKSRIGIDRDKILNQISSRISHKSRNNKIFEYIYNSFNEIFRLIDKGVSVDKKIDELKKYIDKQSKNVIDEELKVSLNRTLNLIKANYSFGSECPKKISKRVETHRVNNWDKVMRKFVPFFDKSKTTNKAKPYFDSWISKRR